MSGSLTAGQVAGFERNGYVAAIDVLDSAETASCRAALLDLYEKLDPALHRHFINLHAVLGWADRLGRSERILDAVESLLGPDIFLWKSKAFVKFPGPGHVPWHQDVPHWNLSPAHAITAWLALSDVTEANGCVRFLPGSQAQGSRAAAASASEASLLSAGLQFSVSDEEAATARPVALAAGQMSLHHGMVVHGSGANVMDAPRIGLALVYIAARTTQLSAPDRHVNLVRGRDTAKFFPPSPPPAGTDEAQLAAASAYFGKLKSGEIPYNVR